MCAFVDSFDRFLQLFMGPSACLRKFGCYLRFSSLAFCLILPLVAGCRNDAQNNSQSPPKANDKPEIIAVSYPLKFLTARLIGDSIPVTYLVPNDMAGRDWKPDRDSIRRLQKADLIIANGIGASYATWLETVSLPESKICSSATRGLSLSDYISVDDMGIVHSHGPEGEHSHPLMVATTWLDPEMAVKQAVYIAEELERIFPQHAESIQRNLLLLKTDLQSLSQEMSLPEGDARWLAITTGPDLKFLSRKLGVEDRHLPWQRVPALETAKSDIETLISELRGDKSQQDTKVCFLVTMELPPALAQFLEERKIPIAQIDVMHHSPTEGDYLTVMKENMRRIGDIVYGL